MQEKIIMRESGKEVRELLAGEKMGIKWII